MSGRTRQRRRTWSPRRRLAAWPADASRGPRSGRLAAARFAGLLAMALLAACGEPGSYDTARRLTGGEPARGRQAIRDNGCHTCHTIPGVPGADGKVGPSLAGLAQRMSVAGRLRNEPDELVRWIRHPQHVQPGSLMPEMGIDEATARDIAAYLYTLR